MQCPKAKKKKRNKTIRQKENQKHWVNLQGKKNAKCIRNKNNKKRPPKWEGHLHTELSNFARESNPAYRLVKILLKHYIQYIRAVYKGQEGNNTHTRATLTQTYLKRRNHSATNKGDRGEQREGRHAHSSKANSAPKKTVVQPTKATEGE